MTKSAGQLESELSRLEAELPTLLRNVAPEFRMAMFVVKAEEILEHAVGLDRDYVWRRLKDIQHRAGL